MHLYDWLRLDRNLTSRDIIGEQIRYCFCLLGDSRNHQETCRIQGAIALQGWSNPPPEGDRNKFAGLDHFATQKIG